MASRLSNRRWLLRDIPRTGVLFVWTAFAVSILIYFVDLAPVWRDIMARLHLGGVVSRAAIAAPDSGNDKLYTGSIIFVPSRGDRCQEWAIDNRTGGMSDRGYVSCYGVAATANLPDGGVGAQRMRAIGKAFLHEKD